MSLLADLKRLENENVLLTNLLRHSHETAANLRKMLTELCPMLRYAKKVEGEN